ncbi:MAG: copper-containing nitrite reductase [Rhizomicrobium sp.]
MFLGEKNDKPLVAVVVAIIAIGVVAWTKITPPAASQFADAAVTVQQGPSLPANYTAPALSGIVAEKIPQDKGVVDIVRDPTDLPPPVGARGPRKIIVNFDTIEVTGQLADGATYRYWTFNGKVPGPFVRVRVGDIVDVHLKNDANSMMSHNVDFHAVQGPGGGAKATEAGPGETRGFEFRAEHPGLYVYHCAVSMAAQHISNGMYGLILVEPAGGLPKVDHEFYVMQGEIYTEAAFGGSGLQTQSYEKLMNETPDYYVFNGAVGALSTLKPLHAKAGETVRIFFGVGGPNKTSSFHAIGAVFDRVYNLGSFTSPPVHDVQTVSVPPGGATVVDMKLPVPGKFMLVDHALSRVERGLAGMIVVTGQPNADLFRDYDPQRSAMVMSH